jgi:tRNA-Thr(GGU) m(6)t(6)A37 methyltransferase TsaA
MPASSSDLRLDPIGYLESPLLTRKDAPRQGYAGAPDAWIAVTDRYAAGLNGLAAGDEIYVFTWLHLAARDALEVHPGRDPANPLRGVFATRSPDRPNPIGLHPVVIREISGTRLLVGPIEAVDGTPVVDIKPVRRRNDAPHEPGR